VLPSEVELPVGEPPYRSDIFSKIPCIAMELIHQLLVYTNDQFMDEMVYDFLLEITHTSANPNAQPDFAQFLDDMMNEQIATFSVIRYFIY